MKRRPAPGSQMRRDGQSGVTLIEMLVALALFSMIGLAGFTMLRTILDAQERTEGRMERLARIDTALRLLASDVETARPGSLSWDGATLTLSSEAGATVWTAGEGGTLRRGLSVPGASEPDTAPEQEVLGGVAGWEWRFMAPGDAGEQWVPLWPPETAQAERPASPRAAQAVLSVALGAGGTVQVSRLLLPVQSPPR
ncbi:prepilin-type N-terminal cleavage/methylation domain-containing protein [Profundibacterium mesophilum]|uniref:Type II secretion system protein J n=1 Tax=Profundibacterium mesophilum KAUST100406-0324 TaxID=1037889 RepID=A0A921NQV7_9RHOB|nr:prepilin-type N-terminal cleavage/methylation domain-containing protein [Profundibacterium mesophilum]KAF0675830.1 Type II secretion system protein J [Profundibacterium mesophilum KAUST100406-0324]